MSFDPKSFLQVSNDLNETTNSIEAHRRTIIGRAYYAVFGHIRDALGIKTQKGVHNKVILTLKDSNKPELKKIGKELESLMLRRHKADYEYDKLTDPKTCQWAINDAAGIIERFDNQNKKSV